MNRLFHLRCVEVLSSWGSLLPLLDCSAATSSHWLVHQTKDHIPVDAVELDISMHASQ